ncbi:MULTISPECIES: lytic murein transglycosylase [Rhizobium]|uniref:Lytic transglycosylase domain-containing protein n=1 Tax=Rhizobium rhododendri TaxID=2506430 RepID=A0ABY8IFZ4_9HYPH|nr:MULTISPECIES: lytic transglycosylase domain-containing protein [Rhizobium]MBO9100372.1 lytic transglycosylase family protein [Rhizobium sp. L58/93]MBO9135488.1 lytic transglycosylase family protein [Rhizobium sp. B209b/85]MBO9170308.1 lytic transglycosylase family protein [Rhizobium sp. L245/93]MBO9186265.1 lytic transglycosylase family protein [Rhizobium sp. E27B/91]MBZ5760629.1 lytic transglycosylase family protein [Rhizobium sp. VS19-DR96]
MRMKKSGWAALAAVLMITAPVAAEAAQCGNTAAGFPAWVGEFKQEAAAKGISPQVLDRAFADVHYNQPTIRADRGQKSFKLSFEEFMKKRGGQTVINRGRGMKQANAALFANIERKYGVPAGPLIAIWGMETGFGSYMGNEHTMSAVSTLSYDCRRSDYFTDQLYAALKLVGEGYLSPSARGAAHGEIGQTQFLPRNVVNFGVDGDGNGRIDMVGSKADALASTANFLRGHGWRPGEGYQPGEPNFNAIAGWNAAVVYQQSIAYIGKQIDGK